MTEITDEWAAQFIDAVISAYHTTRLSDVPVALHILSKPNVKRLLALQEARVSALMAERDAIISSLGEAARAASFSMDRKDAEIAQLRGHLAGAVHEAEWMLDALPRTVNKRARDAIRARLKAARQALGATHEQG